MFDLFTRFVLRIAVGWWLNTSSNSWRRMVVAQDSPHVHAPGANPDRILIAGDGASAGIGVRSHDLGLPGYLARSVTRLTGRATDADIVVTTTMTTVTCGDAISHLELSRFDVILLSLGVNEALSFEGPRRWERDLAVLLDYIVEAAPAATRTIMLSIPYFGADSQFPRVLRAAFNRQAAHLNRITERMLAERPTMTFFVFTVGEGTEPVGADSYARWADHLAPAVSAQLPPPDHVSARSDLVHEASRQRAVERLGVLDLAADPVLDRITTTASNLFGVPFAAVTIIHDDRQSAASVIGMAHLEGARDEAFCDITIRRTESFAIEDTLLDPRFAEYSVVRGPPGIRFYAGYPVESPDGHRIGALCIMDVVPRQFTDQDSALLRQLAQRVQQRLWVLSQERRDQSP